MKIAVLKKLKKFFPKRKKQSGILLVQVGTSEWEPTQDEIDTVINTFAAALTDPNNATILTFRQGVSATFIPIPKEWFGTDWSVKTLLDC